MMADNPALPSPPAPGTSPGTQVLARLPEYPELSAGAAANANGTLGQYLDVSVVVTAELGRASLPLGALLRLGIGSLVDLGRTVSEPVDLLVQGVLFARGEVVVIDDRFAIRIKEILDPRYGPRK